MKKILVLLTIILTFSLLYSEKIADNGQETGTSAATYSETTIYTPRNIYKTVIIKNTGGANSIDYYLRAYPYKSGTAYYTFASGTLTNGSQADCFINNIYYKLIVGIKDTSNGSHSTFSIDYIKR